MSHWKKALLAGVFPIMPIMLGIVFALVINYDIENKPNWYSYPEQLAVFHGQTFLPVIPLKAAPLGDDEGIDWGFLDPEPEQPMPIGPSINQHKAPSWRPVTPENSNQYPSVVHIRCQWDGHDVALCSGFIADRDQDRNCAIVITCAHGYMPLMQLLVVTHDGRKFESSLLCVDTVNDLVILQIQDPGINPMEIESTAPKIGDKVYAVGFKGRETKLSGSWGEVKGDYQVKDGEKSSYLSTTCVVNHGQSGGPVLSASGRVLMTITGTFRGFSCVGPVLNKSLQNAKCKALQ
jgi:S1-C subfamily serine protease